MSKLYKVKAILMKVICKHDYHVKNIYIGATGEKNALHECKICGKNKWVSL